MVALSFATVSELTELIGSKQVGCAELLDQYLDRVDRLNPAINAVVARCDESARERAREADEALSRGERWGPLHGLPMTIKDAFEVAGMPTTSGSPGLADYVPSDNAVAVQRLIDAGAIVFGKTNLPLFAGDFQSFNEVYGTTNNPWDVRRAPGGSSGGSAAALAAGLTSMELGSDIGGSIRNPAHFCGVYGHKPSYGLVPNRGHIPGPPGVLAESDIAVTGPMARSAQDLATMFDVLAGPDRWDAKAWRLELPSSRHNRLQDFRVGLWLDDLFAPVDGRMGDVLHAAVDRLAQAGVQVVDRRPELSFEEAFEVYYSLLAGVMGAGMDDQLRAQISERVRDLPDDDKSSEANFDRGVVQSAAQLAVWDERRQQHRKIWEDYFTDIDLLLCPVFPTAAFPHSQAPNFRDRALIVNGETRPYADAIKWAGLTCGVLLPATAAPVGLTEDGLPVGIQIVAPYLEDRSSLRFAELMKEVVGGFEIPPGFED